MLKPVSNRKTIGQKLQDTVYKESLLKQIDQYIDGITKMYYENTEKYTSLAESCDFVVNFEDFNQKLEGGLAGFYEKIRKEDANIDSIYPFSIDSDPNFFEAFTS